MSPAGENAVVNILLVDDQPGKLLSYEVILGKLGENLLKASSAREALEHLLRTDIAVVLIDVCMPELDGFELATMIREHPRFERTAIIFVSAVQITDLDRLRGYAVGAVDYVSVPVVPEILRAKVKVFAELYRKTRQLEELNAELEERVAQRTAALEASTNELKALNRELEARIEERTRERERALAQVFEMQKLETIGQLTGGVAHDFNNLLTAVLGSLSLLAKRFDSDPKARRLLDNAIQGAERGAALTQRLLAFARRQELKPEVVHLPALVDGMEDLLTRALGPRLRMSTSLPSDLPPVRVDANQLELALLNLVVNARDAMPLSGTVLLEGTAVSGGADDLPASLVPGDYVVLRLSDTGIGMAPEVLAKATEPFFTTKGPGKGTGLGLSMVHGLAVQSGGTMRISSRPGEGTTVELWLPRAKIEADTRPVVRHNGADPLLASGPRRIVLIVDDDPLVSTGAVAMIEDLGHGVLEAHSGSQALDILRTADAVDLVITDYSMPEINGLDLAAAILRERPDVPVVLASGYAEIPHDDKRVVSLPRLAKPYRQEDLSRTIAKYAKAMLRRDLALGVE